MDTTIILAVLVGTAFGFVLDRIGATNPDIIVGMLRLTRLHLAKTILLAIGIGSILMFGGLLTGVIDPGHLSIKGAYSGVFVGGLMLGAGWAVAGFCPGTGLTAVAAGRRDAISFVIGGLLGAAAFMYSYPQIMASGVLDDLFGGKSTLGAITGLDGPALISSLPGEYIGIGVGVVLILLAMIIPNRLRAPALDLDAGEARGQAEARAAL